MAVEQLFLDRLHAATSFEVKGDVLIVRSGEEHQIRFERIQERIDLR